MTYGGTPYEKWKAGGEGLDLSIAPASNPPSHFSEDRNAPWKVPSVCF